MDTDVQADIETTSVEDPFRRAVLRLIRVQQEMASLVKDLAEVETVLSRQKAAVLGAAALTPKTVRQELENALRPLGEERTAATGLAARSQGSSRAADYGDTEKIGSHVVGRVGDVRLSLTIEIDRSETEFRQAVRHTATNSAELLTGIAGFCKPSRDDRSRSRGLAQTIGVRRAPRGDS